MTRDYEERGPTRAYVSASPQPVRADSGPAAARGPTLAELAVDAVDLLEAEVSAAEEAYQALPTTAVGWREARETFRASLVAANDKIDKRFLAAASGPLGARRSAAQRRLEELSAAEHSLRIPAAAPAPGPVAHSSEPANPAPGPSSQPEPEYRGVALDGVTSPIATAPAGRYHAADYLYRHGPMAWAQVRDYLHHVAWPDLAERFAWTSEPRFVGVVLESMRERFDNWESQAVIEALYPGDPYALVDMLRVQDSRWVDTIGTGLGRMFQQALIASLRRMVPRLVETTDALRGDRAVVAADLILTAPMDQYVARALTADAVAATRARTGPPVAPQPAPTLRPVTIEWVGESDPALWNWVRTERPDATVEEVAAAIFAYAAPQLHGISPSVFAYGIVAAPPLFALPKTWALQLPEARNLASPEALAAAAGAADAAGASAELGVRNVAAVASSSLADEVAIAQASAQATTVLAPAHLSDRFTSCGLQLDAIAPLLKPWGLDTRLLPTMAFDARQAFAATGMSDRERAAWSNVAVGQGVRLFEIAGAVAKLPAVRATQDPADPIFKIAEAFAAAATTSHLATTSRMLIDTAYAFEQALTIQTLQANLSVMQAQQDSMRQVTGGDGWARGQGGLYDQTLDDGEHLLTELVNGESVALADLDRVQFDAQKLAMLADLHRLEHQLDEVGKAARACGSGIAAHLAAAMSHGFSSLESGSQVIDHKLVVIRADMAQAGIRVSVEPRHDAGAVKAQRRALAHAQSELAALKENAHLDRYFQEAYEVISDQRLRTALIALGGTLLLSFAGSAAAEILATSAKALVTVEGLESAELIAQNVAMAKTVAGGVKFATEVAVSSVGQSAMTGEPLWDSFITNAMFSGLMATGGAALLKDIGETQKLMSAFERQVAEMGSLEARVASNSVTAAAAAGATWAVKETFAITGHALLGMAVGNAVSIMQGQGPQAAGWSDLLMQGAAVAVGRHVSTALHERHESYRRLAETSQSKPAQQLLAHAEALQHVAKIVERGGNAQEAHELMDRRVALLHEEIALLEDPSTFAKHPSAAPSAIELAGMKAELHAQIGASTSEAMFDVYMHLNGLEELTPGTWRGSFDEIRATVTDARRVGQHVVEAWDSARQLTTIIVDGRTLQIYQRAGSRGAPTPSVESGAHELSTNVRLVAGSEMRGTHHSELPDLQRAASEAVPRLAADVGVLAIEERAPAKAGAASSYVITLADGAQTSVELVFVRIEDGDAARIVANSSRTSGTSRNGIVEGEHVIQLSTALSPADVERAAAHGIARVLAVHERALAGDYANGPSPGVLTAEELGRLAEIRVLARKLGEEPTRMKSTRREILALAEHLGVTKRGAAGEAVLERLKPHLDAASFEALHATRHAPLAERLLVEDAVIEDQRTDLERAAIRSIERPAAYEVAGPGQRANAAQLEAFAAAAARHRALVSQRTLADLRARIAKVPHGKYVAYPNVMVGGGASLAGREPGTLLVDLRGRWQADGGDTIAQTAQQLTELMKAVMGDVRQVAGPNERVPLAAITFWEDTIATRGPVIDGLGTLRMDDQRRMLVDITPSDGSAMVTLEVTGAPVVATGFTPEPIPGAPRIGMTDAVWQLEQALVAVEGRDGVAEGVKQAATVALSKLRQIEHPRLADAATIADTMAGPHAAELRALVDGDGLKLVMGAQKWNALTARAEGQVALGDDANLEARVATMFPKAPGAWHPKNFLFGGTGGTAVSAAELAHPDTTVTMFGLATPAGLLENGQFKTMASTSQRAKFTHRLSDLFHVFEPPGGLGIASAPVPIAPARAPPDPVSALDVGA